MTKSGQVKFANTAEEREMYTKFVALPYIRLTNKFKYVVSLNHQCHYNSTINRLNQYCYNISVVISSQCNW